VRASLHDERLSMVPDELRARYRSHNRIRREGAIANLSNGVEITAHGLPTRLIAWPGTGYQTESVHVLTLPPGQQSDHYCYELAEEALLCHKGSGEVWLREQWVELRPGDLAYFPEGVTHALRNPAKNTAEWVLVSQITPPQFDLYADQGLYNDQLGVINYDSVDKACTNAQPRELSIDNSMSFHDTHPHLRAWNLERADVRRHGALFNVYMGAEYARLGMPMRLILWPGAGTRTVGFNYAFGPDGVEDVIHKHPVSDECLVIWSGQGQFYMGDRWVDVQANDIVLAPCGVAHGHRSRGAALFGGFASPPQLDLLIPTDYYDGGSFRAPRPSRLRVES
jgi:mannose-6-phosphate isomerase-like protein (cupin superfamily)